MHAVTASNERFPIASILNLFLAKLPDDETDVPEAPEQAMGVVDGLVSVSRCSWAEPFDTFGNFAA